MKKILMFFIIAFVVAGFTGCGNEPEPTNEALLSSEDVAELIEVVERVTGRSDDNIVSYNADTNSITIYKSGLGIFTYENTRLALEHDQIMELWKDTSENIRLMAYLISNTLNDAENVDVNVEINVLDYTDKQTLILTVINDTIVFSIIDEIGS